MMTLRTLAVFSPMPPEPNGIADYTYHLLQPLSNLFNCAVYTDPLAIAPDGVLVRDPLQSFRYLGEKSNILHQIGNNPGHAFVLRALREWGGVTTLHDMNLHYLYEVMGTTKIDMLRGMMATSPRMGAAYAKHWHQSNVKSSANYSLFDMLDEVISLSSAVVVHSQFAKRRLRLLYGHAKTQHVVVIPHLVLSREPDNEEADRSELNVPTNVPLLVTSGFATAAKRFDWLIAALDEIARTGTEFFWVHAGKERVEEFALSQLVAKYPAVESRSRITGYLEEKDLDSYIGLSDILVNLRFPSVGENSGTLTRAMGAGKCCVVSDTASYGDLPRDTVVHVPYFEPIPRLIEILRGLLNNKDARSAIGDAARRLVRTAWAPEVVAASYSEVIEQKSEVRPGRALQRKQMLRKRTALKVMLSAETTQMDILKLLERNSGDIEIAFEVSSIDKLTELTLCNLPFGDLLPPAFAVRSFRVETSPRQRGDAIDNVPVILRLRGRLQ